MIDARQRVLRAALIGTGQIARQHLRCLRELPDVEIAAVCDLSPGLAECAAERFGVPRWFRDHRALLAEVRPDVVHVTTPPTSHFHLTMDALDAGAHVIVEKPITTTLTELAALNSRALENNLTIVENYNYLFNEQIIRILEYIANGELGAVTGVNIDICLDILGKGSSFADPNLPHPCLSMAGGAIADFLPHLASLAHCFVGSHRSARTVWTKRSSSPLPSDEFRALVDAEGGIATLGFSASSQPDAFWVRVQGERMHASANLFETRLTINRLRDGPKPLRPLRDALDEAKTIRRAAYKTLWRKLEGGAASYEGLWTLIAETYYAIAHDGTPPVTPKQMIEVNHLIDDLKPVEISQP
ncbi:Gfo/Idh/MocA family oxidoreductase [Singulisphaera sp. Ch08]|uniref:Gfo/Idh/MocA family oxidoreductase n=1 Tax=Singulisphaera sp. Ch08 TaxID=3120278 RepID=A0AAU7CDX9_9BACT